MAHAGFVAAAVGHAGNTRDAVEFMMRKMFAGLMLPFVAASLPDFGPVFPRYAMDLKREAERAPR